MRKVTSLHTFNWLYKYLFTALIVSLSFSVAADVCTETASASGLDSDNVTVTISDFSCAGGEAIYAVTMDASIGFNCPSWYSYDLVVNGSLVSAGMCNVTGYDLTSFLPITSVSIISNDEDDNSDFITLTLTLNISYGDPPPPPPPPTGCEYTVELFDDFGDGWNGGLLTVIVDGTTVLYDITLASGAGPGVHTFFANTDDLIEFVYAAGNWAYENEYFVYNYAGELVFSDGAGGATPQGGSILADCGECDYTVELYDDFGDGWNGGLLTVEVDGNVVLDEITLPSGAGPEVYTFQVTTDAVIDFIYTAGNWAYENEYIVYDANGMVVFHDGAGGTTPTGGQIIGNCDAQLGTLAGVVTDENDTPLQGVTITAEELRSSTTTDENGEYELAMEAGTYTFTFSLGGFLGVMYSNVEILADEVTTQDAVLNSIVGSRCENPYIIDALPLVDYEDNTEVYGDFYSNAWVTPGTSYLNGNDFVAQFTIDNPGYLSGSVSGSWTGVIIVQDCPDPDLPAEQLALGSGSAGGSFEDVFLAPGTYFAIVSTFPSPQFTDFTLNLSFDIVCLDAIYGLWPSATFTNSLCDGTLQTVSTCGFAGEYSLINVTEGNTYEFVSSVATDYITIANELGDIPFISGITPVVWTADFSGVVRFYRHLDDECNAEAICRTIQVGCQEPPPGDDCNKPIIVDAFPFFDFGQTTCGRGNNYSNTCLNSYDGGEDIIYQFTLTEELIVTITMDPKSTQWTGILLSDECPGISCIASVIGSAATPRIIEELLSPGTYYIMIDTWPTPACIPDFDLTIEAFSPKGFLAGVVTDQFGEPLEGVEVMAGVEVTFTDLNGEYEFEVEQGFYDVQFALLGYSTLIVEGFEIIPNILNELDVALEYAPQPACPTLVFPIAATGIVPDAVLEWAASPDATGYKILLYDVTADEWIEGDPDTFEGTDIGNTTTYVPAENFKFGHVYSWMITPYNFSGGPELCAPWSFQVAFGGDITGVVTDSESGLPIEGATVLIEQTLPNNLVTTVVTDENGEYDFEWETGNYKMTFSKYGYADQVFNNVTINLNQTTVRNAALTPFVPYEIPFFEGWDQGTFADQQWSTVPLTGYWQVFGGAGNPAPTARFISGPPALNDYAFNLQSYFINGVGADQVFAQFDLLLSSSSTATVESLSFMIFDGVEWHVIETFDNLAGSIPWTSFTYDISAYATGGLFQIGFKAFGENSASINHWYLDNIYISNKLMEVKPAALFEALNTDEQSTQHLQIFNFGILPLSWEAELFIEPFEWTVNVFDMGWGDEVSWELRDNTGTAILSGGPYSLGFDDTQSVITAKLPLTFYIEAIGTFGDNTPNYVVSCGGEVIVQGQLLGGDEATYTDLTCGGAGDSWLEMPVISGIISGSGNSEIDVNFDALGLPPGTYTVEIIISGANGVIEQVVPVTLEVFDDAFQKIMIPAANSWGYISTYIDLTSKMPLETALADIVEEMIIMLGTDGIFWPGQNINTLGNWDTYKGYKLKMGEEGLLVFFGDPVEDKTVSFPAGTHFIPVLSEFPISALDVFGDHDIEFAFGLDGSIYWPFGGIYTLNTLYPGYGYLVKFNAPATLDFNVTKSTTLPNVVAEVENSTPWNDVTKTGDIHILGISGEALEMLQPGDIVGVFNADGLCTGMSMYAEQNQPFAITVYGNDVTTAMRDGMEAGERMHVMVFSNGEVTELDPVYSTRLAASDGNFANSGVSMITGVKSATGIDVEQANTLRIYPNPSDGLFTIQGADASMKVMVMNSHGQVVYQSDRLLSDKLDLSAQPAGIYFIRLIGNDQIRTEKVIIQ